MSGEKQIGWLRRLLAAFCAALIAATWPLWTTSSEIPQIPWMGFLCDAPFWVDAVALAIAGFGLLAMLAGPLTRAWSRGSTACFLIGWCLLLLLDQHRLQPWAWQFLLVGAVLCCAPNQTGIRCWRGIVASVYIWSAVSKFDLTFLDQHGQLLLGGFLKPLGIDTQFWSEQTRRLAAAAMPVGEFTIGGLLLIRPTRFSAWIGSLVMHAVLIWTLGPWGLDHENGVLIWNLFFICQNTLLFAVPTIKLSTSSPRLSTGLIANAFTYAVMIAPVLENVGYWDHWPAWAVYCARPEKVTVKFAPDVIRKLPESLQQHAGAPLPLESKVPVRFLGWSYTERWCPSYPQSRYQLALVAAVAASAELEDAQITVEIGATPDRRSGIRDVTTVTNLEQLRAELANFWWNTHPRRHTAEVPPEFPKVKEHAGPVSMVSSTGWTRHPARLQSNGSEIRSRSR